MIPPVVTTPRLRIEGEEWGPRRVVRAFDGLVVGSVEFFGTPEPAEDGVPEIELRGSLDREAWGHGAGTEALRGLLVETDRAGVRVRVGVEPADTVAVRVLAKCGFTGLRGSDEAGNLVMVRPL